MKEEFFGAYGSGRRVHSSGGGQSRRLGGYIFNHTQKAESKPEVV